MGINMELDERVALKLFLDLEPIVKKLNALFASNTLSYKKVKWDVDAMEEERDKIKADLQVLVESIEQSKVQANLIIEKARLEANEIKQYANRKNVEAENRLEEVKQFCVGIEKQKYKELSQKAA